MKRAILCAATLLLASGAWGQQAKKKPAKQECDPKVNVAMSDNYTQYKCSPQGKWVVDGDAMKDLADENMHRHKLAAALVSRVITEAEMEDVMQQGIYLIIEPMQQFSEEEKTKEFNDDLAQQFRLREIAKAAKQEKKAPCSSNGVVTTCDAPAWMTKQEEKVPAMSSKGDGWIFTQEPFDVPSKESDAWEPPIENNWQELLGNGASSPCPEPFDFPYGAAEYVCVNGVVHYKVHHRTCADPKRVLLMSEDKVWHCYLFKEKP